MVISLLISPQLHCPPPASVIPSRRCRIHSSNFRCHQIPANSDVPSQTPPLSLDRRALLLGLGGLYTASAGSTLPASAHSSHDNTHTHSHSHSHFAKSAEQPIDYILPSSSAPKRVRRPAHLVDDTFVAKYEEGIRLMTQLPADHPWNIKNHADRHPLGVHNGWLFFPWHRLYLHFFERAIGHLIEDDTFALPYWNFDSPDGMTMPLLYTKNPNSPLYDPTRNPAHFPPAVLDLRYAYMSGDSTALDPADQVQDNLWQIGMAFRQSLELGPLFSGGPMREGEPQYGGRIETLHMAVHQWAGEGEFPYFNMGNPHTTPRDPMFYSLHANMDRLWDIYRGFRGNRDDYSDPEWLNVAFTFYDENGQLVRAKVRDALSSDKLGYIYEQVPLLWAGRLPMKPQTNITMGMSAIPASFTPVIGEFGHEPRTVDTSSSPVQVLVTRPKVRLSKSEEHELVEVLHIRGIDVIPGEPARFDIFVSSPYNNNVSSNGYGVFAGNFIKPNVVHPHDHMKTTNLAAEKPKEPKKKDIKAGLKLGLAPVLEAIDAEGEAKLVVTIVPRDGKVVLDGVGVELLQSDGSLLI